VKKIILLLIISSFGFTVMVDQNAIHKQIKQMVNAELRNKYQNVEIQVLKRPQLIFPDEIYNVEIQKPKKLVGMTAVTVLLTSKTKKMKLQYIVDVSVMDDVLAFSQTVNRKTPITKSTVEIETKDITNELLAGKEILKNVDDISGLRARVFIRKGDILTRANTEYIPDILENKEMSMKINDPNLSITMIVKALEEGFVGDTIRVMNNKYQKVLLAKVLSKSEVLLVN